MIDQLNLFEHWNFNSRSLPGEREGCRYQFGVNNHFNSRPCVRSDKRRKEMTIYELNISILAPCVESEQRCPLVILHAIISILAPCLGSDGHRGIYIIGNHKFQFSLPVWGAILF